MAPTLLLSISFKGDKKCNTELGLRCVVMLELMKVLLLLDVSTVKFY